VLTLIVSRGVSFREFICRGIDKINIIKCMLHEQFSGGIVKVDLELNKN